MLSVFAMSKHLPHPWACESLRDSPGPALKSRYRKDWLLFFSGFLRMLSVFDRSKHLSHPWACESLRDSPGPALKSRYRKDWSFFFFGLPADALGVCYEQTPVTSLGQTICREYIGD
jgi:hypothetical protein